MQKEVEKVKKNFETKLWHGTEGSRLLWSS
jgi:hypothetical protein